MRLVLHGIMAIGMAGVAFADPIIRPFAPQTPVLSRLPDASDGMGAQGGSIYRACPTGPGLGEAVWRGCRPDNDRGPGGPVAIAR